LRFTITSPSSGCEENSHLHAIEHARRTRKGPTLRAGRKQWISL
jgi:hypothetical protein